MAHDHTGVSTSYPIKGKNGAPHILTLPPHWNEEPTYTNFRKYRCDFWVWHPIQESCHCMRDFGVFGAEFIQKFNAMYPWRYHNKATDEQRMKVLERCERNNLF